MVGILAGGTSKAIRPTQRNQVIPTRWLVREPITKFQDRFRKIRHAEYNALGSLESSA